MALESDHRFFIQCDHCQATLRSNPQQAYPEATHIRFFASPLAALQTALTSDWTVFDTHILCPPCSHDFNRPPDVN